MQRVAGDLANTEHGTPRAYRRGCHCSECRAANAERVRQSPSYQAERVPDPIEEERRPRDLPYRTRLAMACRRAADLAEGVWAVNAAALFRVAAHEIERQSWEARATLGGDHGPLERPRGLQMLEALRAMEPYEDLDELLDRLD